MAAVKTAMEMIGKPAGPVRPPLTNTRPQDIDDLRKIMDGYSDVCSRQATCVKIYSCDGVR